MLYENNSYLYFSVFINISGKQEIIFSQKQNRIVWAKPSQIKIRDVNMNETRVLSQLYCKVTTILS